MRILTGATEVIDSPLDAFGTAIGVGLVLSIAGVFGLAIACLFKE